MKKHGKSIILVFCTSLVFATACTPGVDDWEEPNFAGIAALLAGGGVASSAWTQQAAGTTETLRRVRFLNNRYWIVGDGGTFLTSEDGTNWSNIALGTTDDLHDILFYQNILYVIGLDSTLYYSSDGGANWTNANLPGGHNLLAMTTNGTTFVIAGSGFVSSSHGTYRLYMSNTPTIPGSWTSAASLTFGNFLTVEYVGNRFVAGGSDGFVTSCSTTCTSSGNWSTFAAGTGLSRYVYNIAYANSSYILAQDKGSAISSNFTSFTENTVPSEFDVNFRALYYDGTRYLAASSLENFYISTDGTTWTEQNDSLPAFISITSSNTKYIAVGFSGRVYTADKTAF